MSELTITLLRLGYLVLLWVFVLAAISVLRRDLYGTRIVSRRLRRQQAPRVAAVLIGRAPSNTLVLDDDYSSSRHARIYPEGGQWYVEDLGSTNGTFVGRTRITGPTPVGIGSQVKVGQSTLELQR